MNRRASATFFVAAILSALIWALSPVRSQQAEPWDASGPYYVFALVVAGAISGGLSPKPRWAHYLGAVFGQATFEAVFLSVGPLFVLGLLFLLGYSVVFLVAAAVAGFVRTRYSSGPNAA